MTTRLAEEEGGKRTDEGEEIITQVKKIKVKLFLRAVIDKV